jgi:hypothetical protein
MFHLFIWLLNRLGVDMEIHMASALPVGDLSVRMRNDRHEPNGAEKQRPERIPVDPEHRSYSRNATGVVAIDPLLQNGRRLEYDHATRRNCPFGAGLRGTADTLTFLEIFRHGSISLVAARCASRHSNASLVRTPLPKRDIGI